MLMNRGFVKDLTPEERDRMDGHIAALVEEWFGPEAVVTATEDKSKKEKKTKTKAAVVSGTPAVIDRAYLDTRTVYELKELGKDCPAIKGRKPRAELIELVLQHLSGPVVQAPVETTGDEAGSDEELREEAPPVQATEDKAKKEKKEKAPAKKEKAVKEKKEKAPKKEKEKKKKAEETPPESESDDEDTVELREWFHPSEMSKPREERRKYYIDPKTNELYHPERLQAGQAEWSWDEDSAEIIPL
jgi:flagellar biosynthesis GTPase FlhF